MTHPALGSHASLAGRPRVRGLLGRGGARLAAVSSQGPVAALAGRVIERALPARFDGERARDLAATFELRLHSGTSTRWLALQIDHGTLCVVPGPAESPGASAEISIEDVIRLASGSIGWPELVSGGRLTLSGDPFLAMRFPSLFRLPVEAAVPDAARVRQPA